MSFRTMCLSAVKSTVVGARKATKATVCATKKYAPVLKDKTIAATKATARATKSSALATKALAKDTVSAAKQGWNEDLS